MRKPSFLPLTIVIFMLVGAGVVLSAVQGVLQAPQLIAAYFTHVQHPITPSFQYYDKLLSEVVKRNRVDYCAARNNKNLDLALKELAEQSSDEFANDSDRLCYWINAYNLCVIKTIADRYPIKSVEQVTNDINGRLFTAGGEAISPKDIRQMKIQKMLGTSKRGDYTDARMLLLVCGGAMGYPAILDHATTSATLEKDMGENVFKFIRIRYNVYYDNISRTMFISPLFQWNEASFRAYGDPWEFVLYFLYPQERPDCHDFHFKKTYNKKFDWRVNDISTPD